MLHAETEAQGWEMTDIVTCVTSLVIHSGWKMGIKCLITKSVRFVLQTPEAAAFRQTISLSAPSPHLRISDANSYAIVSTWDESMVRAKVRWSHKGCRRSLEPRSPASQTSCSFLMLGHFS